MTGRWVNKLCLTWLAVESTALLAASTPLQFTSTVQLAVQEDNPRLAERAQHVVIEQFANALAGSPELHGKHYEIRSAGNEVVFYLLSSSDMRSPMQAAVATMIERLNGRVRARGRSLFYRTQWTPGNNSNGYLDVVFDDSYRKVVSISAQAVPLRDLLKEIKAQHQPIEAKVVAIPAPAPTSAKAVAKAAVEKTETVEPNSISYLIPGECAERLVDWNFGNEGTKTEAKSLDEVMDDLGGLFGLKVEKKDLGRSRTYIFSGACANPKPNTSTVRHIMPPPSDVLSGDWIPEANTPMPTQVYFPLPPIGQ